MPRRYQVLFENLYQKYTVDIALEGDLIESIQNGKERQRNTENSLAKAHAIKRRTWNTWKKSRQKSKGEKKAVDKKKAFQNKFPCKSFV